MAKDFQRTDRVASTIVRRLSELMQTEVSDPRLQSVLISDVKVTRDLSYAKVFYTLLGTDEDKKEVAIALDKAKSFLRTLLSDRIQLRTTPALQFVYDESVQRADRIDELLRGALSKHPVSDESSEESQLTPHDEETR